MLNQHAVESLYSATYVEDYLDSMENLPDDVMKELTKMKEMDVHFQKYFTGLENPLQILLDSPDPQKEKLSILKLINILMSAQDKGDDKLQIVQQVQDFVDNKVRQLDLDGKNLDFGKDIDNDSRHDTKVSETSERPVKRARRARHEVFVPSILGPSTLEATSFSESASINASVENHHHNTKTVHSSLLAIASNPSSTPASTTAPVSHVSHPSSTAAVQISHNETTTNTKTSSLSSSNTNNNNNNTAADEKSNFNSTTNTTTTSTAAASSSTTTTPKKQSQHKKEVQEKKCKRRKTNKQSDNSPPNIPIDPDEPTYCLCDQVSYGEMIGCDNDLCPIEWFHFSCVQLTTKPKGKWYCPKCRGDRPNVMKPKAIFLKELEKYNREKEEKS